MSSSNEHLAPTSWNPVAILARRKALSQSKKLEQRAVAAKKNPEETANQYAAARKSILGDMSSSAVSSCQECINNAKAARRKERIDLVSKAIVACPSCASEAARLRQDMDEVENMRCAKQVYLDNDDSAPPELRESPPPGFLRPTEAELKAMGLTPKMLQPDGTNFRAAVYIKDPSVWAPPDPPDPKSVLAFRGSTTELEDWENNMMENTGNTPGFLNETGELNEPYYKRAAEIGTALRRKKASVLFVGHSLGGGLASAAQGASGGMRASTYNAAGLRDDTLGKYTDNLVPDASKINAIRIKGEVLTKIQEVDLTTRYVAPDAVGVKRDLAPSHDQSYYREHQGKFDKAAAEQSNQKYDENEEYSAYLHGMDEVIDSMETQKQKDQKVLEDCLKAGAHL